MSPTAAAQEMYQIPRRTWMQLVKEKISIEELKKMTEKMHDKLVKAVVDTEKGTMVVDMEMHADGELHMLENDSKQEHLWGINIHPFKEKQDWVEFDSMINIRPSQGNRSRRVENEAIQKRIISLVHSLVE